MARRISNKTQSTGDRDEYQQSLSAPYSSYQPQTQMHSDYYQQAPGHSHQFHPYQAQSMNNAISERYRAQSKSAAGQSSASATQMPESAQRSDLSSPYADYSDKDAEAGRVGGDFVPDKSEQVGSTSRHDSSRRTKKFVKEQRKKTKYQVDERPPDVRRSQRSHQAKAKKKLETIDRVLSRTEVPKRTDQS